ncbi:MAG: FosX/FosE/FosI family fosfomycin resistance hydrolase [Rhodocyclaceae bacterium]|nr:FosX/FosE/FosI family fosfomycin resistance hydrolase [Rhodocyclaceae bacterium]
MIEGLSHLTFVVQDIARTARLFAQVLDAREVYDSGPQGFSLAPEKFLLIGDLWIALMQGESLAERSYRHVAFKIDEADFDACAARIAAAGVDFRPPRPRVDGEGRSLYFHDFDNHLFELHTGTLDQRLARYASA